MNYRFLFLVVTLQSLFFLGLPHSIAAEVSEPVEYVLQPGYQVVPRSELAQPYQEKVEVRQLGKRTDRWVSGIIVPSVTTYIPKGKVTTAVIVCPGGGYSGLSFDKEGVFIAKWLNERGVAAGVLKYSVRTDDQPLGDRPLNDLQYAIQFMKTQAPGAKIGVIGFSAGGNLVATSGNTPTPSDPSANSSAIAKENGRIDFQVLGYPVVSLEEDVTHGGSRHNLLGASPTEEQVRQNSGNLTVTKDTPASFLIHASDDGAVPDENSLRFYKACREHGVPVEMHLFERGGHGFGMWADGEPVNLWPELLEAWMIKRGYMAEQP